MGDVDYLYEPSGSELHWDGLQKAKDPSAPSLSSAGLGGSSQPQAMPVHYADRQTGMQGSSPAHSDLAAAIRALEAAQAGHQAQLDQGPAVKRAGSGTAATGYDTPLNDASKPGFERWKASQAPGDPGTDYDYPGAYVAGQSRGGDSGHFTDQFKKPNHETFSDESQYADQGPAGHWSDDSSGGEAKFQPAEGQAPAWLTRYMNYDNS